MLEQGTLQEDNYIRAADAAKLVGYSSDYVTRLAREGKVEAKQINRQWFIDRDSLKLFSLQSAAEKRERGEKIREERIKERAELLCDISESAVLSQLKSSKPSALAQITVLAVCLFLFGNIVWFSLESKINTSLLFAGLSEIGSELSEVIWDPIPEFISQTASFSFLYFRDEQAQTVSVDPIASDQSDSDDPDFQGIVLFENEQTQVQYTDTVQNSFSDEVRIDFEGEETGVITPVFREGDGEAYRFLLIPVTSSEN